MKERKHCRRCKGVEINISGFEGVVSPLSPTLPLISFPVAIVLPRSLPLEIENEVRGLLLFLPLL